MTTLYKWTIMLSPYRKSYLTYADVITIGFAICSNGGRSKKAKKCMSLGVYPIPNCVSCNMNIIWVVDRSYIDKWRK